MSRDWTPREMWNADLFWRATCGEGFSDMNITFQDPKTGEVVSLVPSEEKEFIQHYPIFGLLYEPLYDLYRQIDDEHKPALLSTFNDIEEMLRAETSANRKAPENALEKAVSLWYHGELDPGFYYRERNNEMLAEIICEHIGIHTEG